MHERYRDLRREEKRLEKRKTREDKRRDLDGTEMISSGNENIKGNIKAPNRRFKNGAAICKDEKGYLVDDNNIMQTT